MTLTKALLNEMQPHPKGRLAPHYFKAQGYRASKGTTPYAVIADGIAALFTLPGAWIYRNDLIVGSIRPVLYEMTAEEERTAKLTCTPYPERGFSQNSDHYTPNYEHVLEIGIEGLLREIDTSLALHADDTDAQDFLHSMRTTLSALQKKLLAYATLAHTLMGTQGYDDARLSDIANNCTAISTAPPKSFAEGLQLVWMLHSSFVCEGRYAMALGRMDQYLYPLYQADLCDGRMTHADAVELLENTFAKICERRAYMNGDDVVNICIGGVDANGACAVNELSLCILEAVRNLNRPGPNLSARITPDTPDDFLDACLQVIGTGLGYPALMNDEINMAALRRYGYDEADVRNYSMVGCIENFISGKQPPWSDGRFDTPRFLEYVLLDGEGFDTTRHGIKTAPLCEITSMDVFMKQLELQLEHGVKEYVESFWCKNTVKDPRHQVSPFLSCFCYDCITRGKDINMGGAHYPSVHGAALMGVGTVCDSLAAIEKVVFCDHSATLEEIANAMRANFEGYESLRQKLLAAPKYGNNDEFADRYAVWFTSYLADRFDEHRTPDGGGIYVAMAANTNNIHAGKIIGATPDGRRATEPLSDAASPSYGRDVKGATSTLLSVSKPDYTRCACGTVINQKYDPSMFSNSNRPKLLALIRAYFARGGQEIQINATSRQTLIDAMEHPEQYQSLVVRVSGFSALYTKLERDVQQDILQRTQHKA